MKKTISAILILVTLISCTLQAFSAADEIKLQLDGKLVTATAKPVISKGSPLVNPDLIFKASGVPYNWNPKSNTLTGKTGSNTFSVKLPGNIVIINGKQQKLTQNGIVVNSTIMLPLDFFIKALSVNAYYDPKIKTVIIKTNSKNSQTGKFTVTTDAFKNNGKIPLNNTFLEGAKNLSLPLSWKGIPSGTKSFAALMIDMHPMAEGFIHWAAVNIPAGTDFLTEGASNSDKMPQGAEELENNFSQKGYGGPQPPPGSGDHEYKIIIYALSVEKLQNMEKTIMAPEGYADYKRFMSAIDGKVLAKAEITGFFGVK